MDILKNLQAVTNENPGEISRIVNLITPLFEKDASCKKMEAKMNKTRFLMELLLFLALSITAINVWGWKAPACIQPAFKNEKPPKSSIVPPGSEFSFTASPNTMPSSIRAWVEDIEVNLDIIENYGYRVTGNLPAELVDVYAVIKIRAHSEPKSCNTEKRWLIKISE